MDRGLDKAGSTAWIQVVGRVAIHIPGHDCAQLRGSTRTLLALLVAAGRSGTSLEKIARSYWTGDRPPSWQIALRFAIDHLQSHLPAGWLITTTDDTVRLEPGEGWVDAWRVEAGSRLTARPDWLEQGAPFAGIAGVDLVEQAIVRLGRLLPVRSSPPSAQDTDSELQQLREDVRDSLRATRRAIVIGEDAQHDAVAEYVLADQDTHTRVIVGDRGLLLPLGPFAMTFPELRDEITIERGVVDAESPARAWRIVTDALAMDAAFLPQRVIVTNAHELDTTSLVLASWLIERGPLNDFSIILCANNDRDIRWLDFINRSVTAGCKLIHL